MIIIKNQGNVFFGVYITLVIILLTGLGVKINIQSVVTFVFLPIILVLGVFANSNFLKNVPFEYVLLLLLFASGIVSSINAINFNTFLRDLSMSIGVLVSAFIPLVINYNRRYYTYFFVGFTLSFLILVIVMYSSGNMDEGIEDYSDRKRFLLNANVYSYMSYFGNISLIYLNQLYRTKILKIILIGYLILSIYISLVTASRSGFVFPILINILYWFWIYKPKTNKLFFKILFILIMFFATIKMIDIFLNSYLNYRVEYATEHGEARQGLFNEALSTFTSHPFLGVGPGQFVHYSESGSYSHNSYSEIAVTQGIVGLLLLIYLYYFPMRQAYKFYNNSMMNKNLWKLNLLFYFSFFLYNLFYPFYKYTYSMMFFFLIISFQKNLIKNHEHS